MTFVVSQKKAPEKSKWIIWSFFAFIILLLFFTHKIVMVSGETMGTTFYIRATIPRVVPLFIFEHQIEKKLDSLINTFSTYTEDSELMHVNRWDNSSGISISDELKFVFNESFLLYELSHGDWDPTIYPLMNVWGLYSQFGKVVEPPSCDAVNEAKALVGFNSIHLLGNTIIKDNSNVYIDFSSIAKGYGVDQVADVVEHQFRSKSYLVEIGGEVKTKGLKEDGSYYKVGINRPIVGSDPYDVIMTLKVRDKAVATSGNYRRYRLSNGRLVTHVINPHTGEPIESDIVSVTVVGSSCSMADGLATAIMVMGIDDGLSLIDTLIDTEACIISQENDEFMIYKSSGFSAFELE